MKSLETALRVLTEFSNGSGRWSVGDLCSRTGLNKSQMSKILSDFRASGLLLQDPRTKEYSVGLYAVALAGQYIKGHALSREALAPMRRLVDLTGHTATLCVLHGADVMYLMSVEGPLFVEHGWRAGSWLPFHATAAGKVLVANQQEGEIDRIVAVKGLPRFTPATVCDPATLKAQFKQIRKRGLAITHSEGTPGLGAQAVPILEVAQRVSGALGLVYPDHLVSPKQQQAMSGVLHDTARELSHRMGATVYPFGGSETGAKFASAPPVRGANRKLARSNATGRQ